MAHNNKGLMVGAGVLGLLAILASGGALGPAAAALMSGGAGAGAGAAGGAAGGAAAGSAAEAAALAGGTAAAEGGLAAAGGAGAAAGLGAAGSAAEAAGAAGTGAAASGGMWSGLLANGAKTALTSTALKELNAQSTPDMEYTSPGDPHQLPPLNFNLWPAELKQKYGIA